jgi:hypothetical protein
MPGEARRWCSHACAAAVSRRGGPAGLARYYELTAERHQTRHARFNPASRPIAIAPRDLAERLRDLDR